MRALAVLLVITTFMLVSCNGNGSTSSEEVAMAEAKGRLSKIENETGLDFPAESIVVNYYEPERFVDPIWVARILLPESSRDDFLELLNTRTDYTGEHHGALSKTTDWWQPVNIVLDKHYIEDTQTFVHVVVSREEKDYALYIECAVI